MRWKKIPTSLWLSWLAWSGLALPLAAQHETTPASQEAPSEAKASAGQAETPALNPEEEENARARLKKLREMEKLLHAARDAGFKEVELRKMTIDENGQTINIWDFVEQEQKRLKLEEAGQGKGPPRKYLTVQDIKSELREKEAKQLSKLRDQMIFSGESEE